MSKSCPYCGNVVDDHIGKCPRCGLDFANRPAQPVTTTPSSPGGFPTAPDPFSSPGIWNPSKGQPVLKPVRAGTAGRRIAIAAAILLVAGLLGGAFFYVTKQVTKSLDPGAPESRDLHIVVPSVVLDDPGGGGKDNGGKGGESLEVSGSRELFLLMKQNGAKCTGFNQVIESSTVDAASCFAGTEVWTIQVFFDDLSYDAVVANYRASDTITVAYGGNWTVLVQTEKSARKIAHATGGRWS
jgi:hypothetical protein